MLPSTNDGKRPTSGNSRYAHPSLPHSWRPSRLWHRPPPEENLRRRPRSRRKLPLPRPPAPPHQRLGHRRMGRVGKQSPRPLLQAHRRWPGFSALAIFCLTLGIGANAAVFSWIEGILFRPYPLVAHQEQLAALTGTARGEVRPDYISWPELLDLQKSCTLIDSFIVTKITGTTLSIGDRAEVTTGSIVSANYFDAVGVHPILGRAFEPGEDLGRNAHPVTIISYQLWQGRFKGDPQIVGKTQRLNGVLHTIVGVAPPGFYGTFVGWAMQFWVPASMEETFESGGYKLEDRGARWIESYVRLKPGVTLRQAQEEISAAAKRLEADYPATNRGRGIKLWPLWQTPFNNAGTMLPTLEIML